MLALCTGCAGFIGRHGARELAAAGFTVLGLDAAAMPEARAWGLAHFYQTPVQDVALEDVVIRHGRPDLLLHCAGSGSVAASLQNPQADFQANVQSALKVLDFSRRHSGAIKIVLPSSAAVYGDAPARPLTEDTPARPASPYGAHKKIMEDLARSYGRHFGVPSICVRLFSVYGPGLRKQLLWDACRQAAEGRFSFFGHGQEVRDWLHVRDAARLLVLAAGHASPAVPLVNGGTGRGATVREVLTELGRQWSPPLTPSFTGQAKAGDPERLVAEVGRLRAWGFAPDQPLERGLAEYTAWFQGQNHA